MHNSCLNAQQTVLKGLNFLTLSVILFASIVVTVTTSGLICPDKTRRPVHASLLMSVKAVDKAVQMGPGEHAHVGMHVCTGLT